MMTLLLWLLTYLHVAFCLEFSGNLSSVVQEGETAHLDCSFRLDGGEVAQLVVWGKYDQRAPRGIFTLARLEQGTFYPSEDVRERVSVSADQGELLLNEVSSADDGMYACAVILENGDLLMQNGSLTVIGNETVETTTANDEVDPTVNESETTTTGSATAEIQPTGPPIFVKAAMEGDQAVLLDFSSVLNTLDASLRSDLQGENSPTASATISNFPNTSADVTSAPVAMAIGRYDDEDAGRVIGLATIEKGDVTPSPEFEQRLREGESLGQLLLLTPRVEDSGVYVSAILFPNGSRVLHTGTLTVTESAVIISTTKPPMVSWSTTTIPTTTTITTTPPTTSTVATTPTTTTTTSTTTTTTSTTTTTTTTTTTVDSVSAAATQPPTPQRLTTSTESSSFTTDDVITPPSGDVTSMTQMMTSSNEQLSQIATTTEAEEVSQAPSVGTVTSLGVTAESVTSSVTSDVTPSSPRIPAVTATSPRGPSSFPSNPPQTPTATEDRGTARSPQTPTPELTATEPVAADPDKQSSDPQGINTALVAGVTVGVILLIALLIGALVVLVLIKQRRTPKRGSAYAVSNDAVNLGDPPMDLVPASPSDSTEPA